jgi:hypothetical protein
MSDNRPQITAYCLDWHIATSSAFAELLVKPLAPYADIQFSAWTGQGELPPATDGLTIFCQMPPTEQWLAECVTPIVWIPMADAIYYPPNMKNHPMVRVVAFSDVVEKMAHELNLPVIRLRYFVNPADFPQTSFDGKRVMLYWNRTGLFYKRFVVKLCHALKVDLLIFRSAIDPRIDERNYYELPPKIGDTHIETHATLTSFADYLALLHRANIYIAPRFKEGVGLAFLEAMACGCFVIGYDQVAMNEYIVHGQNGWLLPAVSEHSVWIRRGNWFIYRVLNKLSWKFRGKPTGYPPKLTMIQNWDALADADIARMGANARQSMADGYARWLDSITGYARFVLNWTD